jgi:hypothetical protein
MESKRKEPEAPRTALKSTSDNAARHILTLPEGHATDMKYVLMPDINAADTSRVLLYAWKLISCFDGIMSVLQSASKLLCMHLGHCAQYENLYVPLGVVLGALGSFHLLSILTFHSVRYSRPCLL